MRTRARGDARGQPYCASTPRPAARWSRASVPGSLESGEFSPSRGCHWVRVQVCASTPRPAARTMMPDTPIDAGILPATLMAIRMWVGFVLGGPPGRRMARPPAASCGLTGRATDDRSAGVLAGGAPSSDNLPDEIAIDRRVTPWLARRCAVLGREVRHIRARVDPVRWGGSRARTPGSRLPHCAQGVGGRMPPMLRNPLRPGGPQKTNPATVRISTVAAGRMPASIGVSGIISQAAGRGVDAQT